MKQHDTAWKGIKPTRQRGQMYVENFISRHEIYIPTAEMYIPAAEIYISRREMKFST